MRKKLDSTPHTRVLFFDESRFGTHSKIAHGWYKTGSRTPVHVNLGFKNFYLYSAIDTKTGEDFTLEMPNVNTQCMNIFMHKLTEHFKDESILLVMDGAGWHKSKTLKTPSSVSIQILPPYSPELNPVERFWLHLKKKVLNNKLYLKLKTLRDNIELFLRSLQESTIKSLCACDYLFY